MYPAAMMSPAARTWMSWVEPQLGQLGAGTKVEVPYWLPHPLAAGFRALDFATPEGQCANWGLSLRDGSRLHAHQFANGRLVLHRDVYDPAASPLHLIAHLLAETWVGPALLVLTLVAAAFPKHSGRR